MIGWFASDPARRAFWHAANSLPYFALRAPAHGPVMTIAFHCPSCGKWLKTRDDKAGRRTRCPECAEPLTIPQSGSPDVFEAEGSQEPDGETGSGRARGRAGDSEAAADEIDGSSRLCPMCGETIRA